MIVSFYEMHGFCYEFQAILSVYYVLLHLHPPPPLWGGSFFCVLYLLFIDNASIKGKIHIFFSATKSSHCNNNNDQPTLQRTYKCTTNFFLMENGA